MQQLDVYFSCPTHAARVQRALQSARGALRSLEPFAPEDRTHPSRASFQPTHVVGVIRATLSPPPPPRPPRGVLAHIPTRCQLPHTTKEKERHVYHTGYYNTRGAVEVVLLLTHVFLGTTYRIISCSLIVHARGTHVLGIVPYTGIYFYLCKRVTLFGRTR